VTPAAARADPGRPDRAALVRRAFLEAVAADGFHGAAMAAVARRAGVATGTAYVHYASKDDLVLAVYREVKADLGRAAVDGIDPSDPPRERFLGMWHRIHEHLAADPDRARFLVQVEASPYAAVAHDVVFEADDPLLRAAGVADLAELLVDLPLDVLFDLGLGPAVRLAARSAGGTPPDAAHVLRLAEACWRAVTVEAAVPSGRARRRR
jgi:TetR/AcrR family transcriptional repressor of multidrug resistance operon